MPSSPARPPDATRDRLSLDPSGSLRIDGPDQPSGVALTPANAAALLDLVATPTEQLEPHWAWARQVGREYLIALALRGEQHRGEALPLPEPVRGMLLDALPPMHGLEYAHTGTLREVWTAVDEAAHAELARWPGTVHAYLQQRSGALHGRGRIVFHLAEQKRDAAKPFGFLATCLEHGPDGRERHVPLGRALAQPELDPTRMLELLRPVHAAMQRSPLVKELWDSGRLRHPLAFDLDEAYQFLLAVPDCEAAGIAVRVPDWWRARGQRGVRATATVGARQPSTLGLEALLAFDAGLSLDGERLDSAEEKELLRGARGLRLVRGRWVEVDPDRLKEAVTFFGALKRGTRGGGLPLRDALRLLAGADGPQAPLEPTAGAHTTAARVWSGVEAGPWLAELMAQLAAPESSAATDPGPALHATLRPYQRRGVAWLTLLARLGLGACLADDMGLGKTIQVIAAMLVLAREGEHGPHLLVLPTSLLGNWQAELARFAPQLRVFVAHRSEVTAAELAAPPLEAVDVVLTTYGTLPSLSWTDSHDFGLVVLDEAQAIKNPGTRQAKSVKALRARARVALTGTPVENRLGDLWSLFDFLDPGLLGSAAEFTKLTKRLLGENGPGFAPLRRLLRPYILRRMKTDPEIAPDLPEKTTMQVLCGLTPNQVALYEATVKELARSLERGPEEMERRGLVLSSLLRLKQICDHPTLGLGNGEFAPEESGKLQRLGALCEELAARQERALVFTQFREMTGPLDTFLAGVFGRPGLVLHGGTAARRRAALVEEFQREDGPPYMVLSLKAGGTGLNLTAANHVVHFDRWWNPAVENQATDRAFRIGQRRNVFVHAFTCRGTIEERIAQLLESKRALAEQLLTPSGEVALTELSSEELMSLVRLDLRHAAL